MKKEIIVIGDVEMGVGNITDDFISDTPLSKLILSLRKRKHSVDIVFNGDTFDFLKAPIIVKGKETYPHHITKKVALNKLYYIHKAHKKVFDALKMFLKQKKNIIFFVIGNHDPDLHFRAVQQKIRSIIGKNTRFGMKYQYKTVHVEHGHEFDTMNKIGLMKTFVTYRGKKILNLPWVSMGVIDKMVHLKNKHPLLERIKPIPLLFHRYKKIKNKVNIRSFIFTLKSFLLYPTKIIDPTKKLPLPLVKEALRRFRQVNYEIHGIIDAFFKELLGKPHNTKFHVLSHIHIKKIEEKGDLVFIHPDTWRDEYTLDRSGRLKSKQKNYVQIILNNDTDILKVHTIPHKRSVWKFDDLIKNEVKYLKLARKEEGYTSGRSLKAKT